MKTLALAQSKLQPPPTKTEVIDALTRLHELPDRVIESHSGYVSMIRKEVQMGMSGMGTKDERVNALLKDETSKAALVKMLEAIS